MLGPDHGRGTMSALILGSVRKLWPYRHRLGQPLEVGGRVIMEKTPGCVLLMQSEWVEFPGPEETTGVTFSQVHHIRPLTQLPLSLPPLCPALSLVSSLQLPELLQGKKKKKKKMNGRPQEDRGQPCSR